MKGLYGAFYIVNIVFQAIFDLLFYIAVALLLSWLGVTKLGLPTWVYVPAITLGAICGMVAMIRFTVTAMRSLESIEGSQKKKRRKNEDDKKQ